MNLPAGRLPGPGLLVDDDEMFLMALRRSLQRRGVETVAAQSGAEALSLARSSPPAFAVVDLKLIGESGLALIEPLRAIRPDMRILLLTGYASVATAVEAIKRGADNYLPKPVSVGAILRALGVDEPEGPLAAAEPPAMTPLRRLEWEHIQQALADTDGNISAAARLLGMHRRSLQRKLAKRPGPERSRE
jgi:two-component system response regulator RegA